MGNGGILRLIYGGILRFASANPPSTGVTSIDAKRKPAAGARKHAKDLPKAAAELRKPRADCARNRQRLIDAAKTGFAEIGMAVSLEEIARRAGVGIGTLYRHFPTRDDVVEAVYRREVEQLAEAVPLLLQRYKPEEALHRWMHLFVDYIATKRLIAPSLVSLAARSTTLYASSTELISGAIATLVRRAVASGAVRKDIDPGDLLRAMIGVSYQNPDAGWEASARRVIDLLMDGLRHRNGR
jgi:AcrR family transcriptional regulator